MEIPQLVRERLGDEPIEATVNLGDEDLVCVTPSRTLVYRSEGLLSDESVSIFAHDVERLDVSEGRRKTKFVFEYVDGTETFTVPGDRTETLLKLLLGGILQVASVTTAEETVSGVFSFSELTLAVTSERLVKHVGEPVWDEDYEEYPYADVTGLAFEEGSVATQVVISVNGRPQRIKAPTDEARKVEQTLTQALFTYYDVGSLAELNDRIGQQDDEPDPDPAAEDSSDLSLDDGISPLVGDDAEKSAESATGDAPAGERASSARTPESSGTAGAHPGKPTQASDRSTKRTESASASSTDQSTSIDTVSTTPESQSTGADAGASAIDPEEIEAMQEQLSQLTAIVEKQNEQIREQQETIEQLIEELRRGR